MGCLRTAGLFRTLRPFRLQYFAFHFGCLPSESDVEKSDVESFLKSGNKDDFASTYEPFYLFLHFFFCFPGYQIEQMLPGALETAFLDYGLWTNASEPRHAYTLYLVIGIGIQN